MICVSAAEAAAAPAAEAPAAAGGKMATGRALVTVRRPDGTLVRVHDENVARELVKLLPGVGGEVRAAVAAPVAAAKVYSAAASRPLQRALTGSASCSTVLNEKQETKLPAPEAAACRAAPDGYEVVPPEGRKDVKLCPQAPCSAALEAEGKAHSQAVGPGADSGAGCQRHTRGGHMLGMMCSICGETGNHPGNTECFSCGATFIRNALSRMTPEARAGCAGCGRDIRTCSSCGEKGNLATDAQCFRCGEELLPRTRSASWPRTRSASGRSAIAVEDV